MKIITFATESYLVGTRALLRSIIANGKLDKFDFIVMTEGPVSKEAELTIAQVKADTKFISRESLGEFKLPDHLSIGKTNWKTALQKLLILKLPIDEVMIFIDSDIICVGDLNDMAHWTHLTAPVVFGITLPASVNGRPLFSAGVFAFEPSIDLFDKLQAFVKTMPSIGMAEMDILNQYFSKIEPDSVHLVGVEWEMLRRIYRHHPTIWRSVANKKLIHFVGRKPWESNQEAGYRELDLIWKNYGLR